MDTTFERASTREKTIWPAFIYAGRFDPDVTAMRNTIFGLYTMTYRHGHAYLNDITSEELQRLLDQYEAAMSELDAEEQAVVLDLASRRYVDAVDRAIKQAGLVTKSRDLDAKEVEVGYKEDALDVDREELQTKRDQIQLAEDKAENTIKELETRIELEGLDQAQVEVDKSRRQLEFQRTQLAVLEAAIKGIDIQIAISEAALNLVELDAEKSRLIADAASLDSQIAKTALTELELEIDEEELSAITYDITETLTARLAALEARKDTAEKEIKGIENQQDREADLRRAALDEQIARTQAALQRLADREAEALARGQMKIADAEQEKLIASQTTDNQVEIAEIRAKVPAKRASSQKTVSNAAVDAASTIASANIVNTLTHQIRRA